MESFDPNRRSNSKGKIYDIKNKIMLTPLSPLSNKII